jgi:DNA-binding LacI/PurR family transcriptional regulator
LPRRGGYSTGGSAKRSHKHIAIITDLDHPPSPRYHVEILFRVIKAVEQANYVTSIFHASTSDPSMQTVTERLLRIAKPDAIVWFRITPDGASLYAIRTYSTELPCLVIAGARLLYPPPVIGHIFPDQASLETSVDGWARRLRDLSSGQFSEVVLVSLAREELSYNFPQESAEPSIRNERIDLVMKALTGVGLSATNEPVPDYSGSGAFPVFRKHPNALGFVCLSDELAVAMKHLWMAAGRTGDPSDRIIGFDNSSLAEEYAITSIGQSIDKIGDLLVRRLGEFFNARKSDAPETWPSCKNLMTELSLTVRSGD